MVRVEVLPARTRHTVATLVNCQAPRIRVPRPYVLRRSLRKIHLGTGKSHRKPYWSPATPVKWITVHSMQTYSFNLFNMIIAWPKIKERVLNEDPMIVSINRNKEWGPKWTLSIFDWTQYPPLITKIISYLIYISHRGWVTLILPPLKILQGSLRN
jgi:hypothetical protein